MMNKAVIALGSNIEPEKNVEAALREIADRFLLLDQSDFCYTEPLGIKDQPDFLNGVALVDSALERLDMIASLKKMEQSLGRNRDGPRYGPRKIDLDLVVYNGEVVDLDVYNRVFLQNFIHEVLPEIEY